MRQRNRCKAYSAVNTVRPDCVGVINPLHSKTNGNSDAARPPVNGAVNGARKMSKAINSAMGMGMGVGIGMGVGVGRRV